MCEKAHDTARLRVSGNEICVLSLFSEDETINTKDEGYAKARRSRTDYMGGLSLVGTIYVAIFF